MFSYFNVNYPQIIVTFFSIEPLIGAGDASVKLSPGKVREGQAVYGSGKNDFDPDSDFDLDKEQPQPSVPGDA